MKDQQKFVNNKKGYIALTSILVIAAIVVSIGYSVSLLAISEGQLGQSAKFNEEAMSFVEGCVEEALNQLRLTNGVPTTIVLPEGTCTISGISNAGTTWTFTTSGTVKTITKRFK